MKRLSAKFHIASGHAMLVVSLLLVAVVLGFVPDQKRAIREGRAALAESIAASASALLAQNDIDRLRSMLRFLIERNTDVLSVAVRPSHGQTIISIGDHEAHWHGIPGEYSLDSQLSVPIWSGGEKWGYVEIRSRPLSGASSLGFFSNPVVKLVVFLALTCFVGFYLQLGRALRDLNPSRAIPPHVRTALDTLAEGLLVADLKGNIVLANRAFSDLIGAAPDELLGRQSVEFGWITPDGRDLEESELPWMQTIRDGTPQRDEVICLRTDDSTTYSLHVNSSPVLASGGIHSGVLISFDDVTALEEHKAALAKSMADANSANKAKSEFLANMSHEIRTPMNAILGFTEVLRRGYTKTETEWKKHLNTIHSSGKHLLNLINDILDLSKVEAGRLDVERVECSPHLLIREVVTALRVKAQEKGIELEFIVDGPIPETVLSDVTRLRQILTNLIGNSIKFTEHGAVQVVARLASRNGQSMYVMDVIDTGIGMSEDKLDTVFDPFVQADSSVTRQFGGTGLGLAISRKFARALRGDIVARSELGKGSTLSITFDPGPLEGVRMVDAATALANDTDEIAEVEGNWQFDSGRVLVVDDSEENRELLELVLGVAGLEVTQAENGQVGVERVFSESVDVVLMDMQMPVMDGATATSLLRERGVRTPIIALTGNAMKGSETECIEAGCDEYLTKPVDVDLLMQALSRYLPARRVAAKALRTPSSPAEPLLSAKGEHSGVAASEPSRPDCASNPHNVGQQQFARALDRKLQDVEAAHADRDLTALADLASWLKEAAATMGIDGLAAPAARIEAYCSPDAAIHDAMTALRDVASSLKSPTAHAATSPSRVGPPAAATAPQPNGKAPGKGSTTSTIAQHPRYAQIQAKFTSKLQERMIEIDAAWEQRDFGQLSRLAHALMGSSGTVGLTQYVEPAGRLESASMEEDAAGAESAIEALRQLIDAQTRGGADSATSSDAGAMTGPVSAVKPSDSPAAARPSVLPRTFQTPSNALRGRFTERLQERADAVDVACQSGDLEAVARFARWLETAAATVQLGDFVQPARNLEALARSQDTSGLQAALDELRDQIHDLTSASELVIDSRS